MTFGIYCIEHIESGRKYIGKSKNIEDRFKKHKTQLHQPEPKNGVNSYLWNLVNKYGIDSLKFWIVEEVIPQDDALLADREVFWMDELKTLDRQFGFNLKRDSSSGTTFTPEARENIRKGKLGPKNPNFGKPMHPNCKKALQEAERSSLKGELSPIFGMKRSDETKQRLRESKLGEKNPNYGLFGQDNPSFGSKRTEEQRKFMAARRKGTKWSEGQLIGHSNRTHKYSYEQYDLSGNFVNVFRHADDLIIAGFLPPNVTKAVTNNCTHHGFYWRKIPKIDLGGEETYKMSNIDKKIEISRLDSKGSSLYVQYSSEGILLRDFTAQELRESGFDLGTVLKCCKGIGKFHKGFKWKKVPKPDQKVDLQIKVASRNQLTTTKT